MNPTIRHPAPAVAARTLIVSDERLPRHTRDLRRRAASLIHHATGHLCLADYLQPEHPARRALVNALVPQAVSEALTRSGNATPDLFSFDRRSGDWRFWSIADDRASANLLGPGLEHMLGSRLLTLTLA